MTLASDTDLWMFVASSGGLTAGRVDPDGALFPYRTVDQLHEAHHHTGPITLIRIDQPDGSFILWKPFSTSVADSPELDRSLYKNTVGNHLIFEETNHELGLTFSYSWAASDEFGWVRTSTLENIGGAKINVNLLDGLRNILPYGAPLSLYQQSSNLVDAYKKSEIDEDTGLGIFSLSSSITDRAEALEALQANIVWCCGLEDYRVHLCASAIKAFRHGQVIGQDAILNGAQGNYLVSCELDPEPQEKSTWRMVGNTGRDHAQIIALRRGLLEDTDLEDRVADGIEQTTENLRRNVASADGLQLSGQPKSWSHHFANVLFNNMRGGVFDRNYDIPAADFLDFLATRNRAVADRWKETLAALPDSITVGELRSQGRDSGDADFERLCYEYLPLYFGRRHGDPSRPWNRFSIRVRNRTGERELNYQGNWRDIFQNWEALCTAYPEFLPSIVAKFVNASTVDGFNPYRVTREGIDWEIETPEDPWSNIGYWGDHQIVYLLRLLEGWNQHDPTGIASMLSAQIFSYADVPYRLKPYAEILKNPSDTIEFDTARADLVDQRVGGRGSDGKLLTGSNNEVLHVNLLEKLLVPALSKLSNLVPGGGIWMNTQRPEWNDANNALAGGGISVVTLCYLRRYLSFLVDLLKKTEDTAFGVSAEVADWFAGLTAAFAAEKDLSNSDTISAQDRKRLMDALGGVFETYRKAAYGRGLSGKTDLPVNEVIAFCGTALAFIDGSICANRREDGLFHTYNVLEISDDGSGADILRLQEMLEGQVAVLSSGMLTPAESMAVMERLFASRMYRPEERSFLLYPERTLPGFLEKNRVSAAQAAGIGLLSDLQAANETSLLVPDIEGGLHFHGDLQSDGDVAAILDDLGRREQWSTAVSRDRAAVLDLFEETFHHKSFTGRSGTMYGYEGLGCIYWHMVSKLLLAVQEVLLNAKPEQLSLELRDDLIGMYFRVRAGIGYEKSVAEYGAFPTDPYSHTPGRGGAKQPGMTGQVKEEILTRRGELGILVENGTVCFLPTLLKADEFMQEPTEFAYVNVSGEDLSLALPAGSLAFTLCQVPVVFKIVDDRGAAAVRFSDGSTVAVPDSCFDADLSREIFSRSGRITQIQVGIPRDSIL
jgi:hypothetical protein